MNLPSPAEQFASRKRLDSIFRPFKPTERYEPKRVSKVRELACAFAVNPNAPRCPWPRPLGYIVSIKQIVSLVAHKYEVQPADILGHRRTGDVVKPRQIACYLAKTITGKSLPDIGNRMGGRDHTTILHALRRVETLIATDAEFAAEVFELRSLLLGGENQA